MFSLINVSVSCRSLYSRRGFKIENFRSLSFTLEEKLNTLLVPERGEEKSSHLPPARKRDAIKFTTLSEAELPLLTPSIRNNKMMFRSSLFQILCLSACATVSAVDRQGGYDWGELEFGRTAKKASAERQELSEAEA